MGQHAADWLEGKSPTTFLVPANGQPKVHGSRFHQETERLAKWLIAPKNLAKAEWRVREAAVTAKGKAMVARIDAARDGFYRALFADWTPKEVAEFTRLLRRFADGRKALKRKPPASKAQDEAGGGSPSNTA